METNKSEVVAYYDALADRYDDDRFGNSYGRFIDAEERRILDTIFGAGRPAPGERRLELACGTGRLTDYATHALDASAEMLARAKQRHDNVEFHNVPAEDTGFPDGRFDAVYGFHLMMHLEPELLAQIRREARRILKPGGRLVFDIPSKQRRRLLRHRQSGWHGATELSCADVQRLIGEDFEIRRTFGYLFLPIHHLPERLRRPLLRADYGLANSRLQAYSSYQVYELVKR